MENLWKCQHLYSCKFFKYLSFCAFSSSCCPRSCPRSCRHCRREFHQSCHRKIVALFPKLDPLSRLRKFPAGFWAFSFVAHYFSGFPANWVIVSTFFPSFFSSFLPLQFSLVFVSLFEWYFMQIALVQLLLDSFLIPFAPSRQQLWPKKAEKYVSLCENWNPCHKQSAQKFCN